MSQKYNIQNKYKSKKIIIIAIIVLTLFLLFMIGILNSIKQKNEQKEQAIVSGNFASIKDILEYYGCKYIKEKESSVEGFYLDIYTEFKYNLYDDEKSNEKFYNEVINKIAQFTNFKSFRMLDTSKDEDIEIKVVCGNGKVQTIYINGIEDYFIYMDSQIDLSKYKEIKTVEILAQAPELVECIQNGWSSNTNFGSREAIFQDYYIYFDEGIKARTINSKIYNIVFEKNYVNSVVNGFTVGTNSDIIISKLGTPIFQNEDKSVIGYKSKDLYVFFEENQISIYRNTSEDGFDEFFSLVDDFLDDKYTLLEFMNELTYIWPDYAEYTYDENTVFLTYPNKGVDVKINYDNTDGIVLYNNVGVSQDIVKKYLKHTEFVAKLQVDNIYNAELRRYEKEQSLLDKCNEYQEEYEKEDTRNRGNIYKYYADLDSNDNIKSMYFISQDDGFVDCELNDGIDTYVWLNDYCFAYSKMGKGIYFYDLKNQTKGTLISGNDKYEIASYEDGILKYDESQINVKY